MSPPRPRLIISKQPMWNISGSSSYGKGQGNYFSLHKVLMQPQTTTPPTHPRPPTLALSIQKQRSVFLGPFFTFSGPWKALIRSVDKYYGSLASFSQIPRPLIKSDLTGTSLAPLLKTVSDEGFIWQSVLKQQSQTSLGLHPAWLPHHSQASLWQEQPGLYLGCLQGRLRGPGKQWGHFEMLFYLNWKQKLNKEGSTKKRKKPFSTLLFCGGMVSWPSPISSCIEDGWRDRGMGRKTIYR